MTEIASIDWFGRWRTSVFSENTAFSENCAFIIKMEEICNINEDIKVLTTVC